MDGSGTAIAPIALDRNDGATRTHQDAVDSDCSVLTRTEFDEVTIAGSSTAPHMTWVVDGDFRSRLSHLPSSSFTIQWCMIWI